MANTTITMKGPVNPGVTPGFTPESGYSVSGTFAKGEQITITKDGGGFGTGPTIRVYDCALAEEVSDEQAITTTTPTVGGYSSFAGAQAYYDDQFTLRGNLSLRLRESTGGAAKITETAFPSTDQLFVSYWLYSQDAIVVLSGSTGKMAWALEYDGANATGVGWDLCLPTAVSGRWRIGGNGPPSGELGLGPSTGLDHVWQRANRWCRFAAWLNGTTAQFTSINDDNINGVRQEDFVWGNLSGATWAQMNVPGWAGDSYGMWYAEVYLATGSNAAKRFELGNASSWSSCTETQILDHSSWADGTVTVNLRSTPGTNWLYWFNGSNSPALVGQFG